MSEQTISVYQAASQLGISVHTVRRWCKEFAPHLSEGATPETGSTRRLSVRDMGVLAEVSRLRGQGLSTPLIHERLHETVFPAPLTGTPTAAQEGPGATQTAIVVVDAMQSVVAPLAARVEALEAQRLRVDVVWVGVACFIAGLIVGLAVWWF